jgi:hypothetical protein
MVNAGGGFGWISCVIAMLLKTGPRQSGQRWLYRDWVIAAFNQNTPYDDFILKQLAADQMPGTAPADRAARLRSVI